ncbi:MAG: MFS transporter [Proteobacteria bacterium]|nr:MFS transporter [Pseudomonadota bacterium]
MRMVARFTLMLTLVLAGEIVFGLPFHTARFYRPTMLEAFGFTNTQLGDVFAVYGAFAMLAYFPGGALADRFSARSLLALSLVATAAGGLYMATYPGETGMAVLYGYWGITTILLFWSALIRATREWGGDNAQGAAFGILEGGRGIVAALIGTAGVAVLAMNMPDDPSAVTNEERQAAFRSVITMYSLGALGAAALVWFLIPPSKLAVDPGRRLFRDSFAVLRRPLVWAQAAIIVCAYCGFKGLDNYALYAVQVLGMNEVDGARLAAYAAYIRPFAAVLAGVLADRWSAGRTIGLIFGALAVSYLPLAKLHPEGNAVFVIYANVFVSMFAVFSMRGVYFALLGENGVPAHLTGAVAGAVSFVGYTPEIFFGPVTGRILDANPGAVGHQNYFLFLAVVMAAGVVCVAWLLRLQRRDVVNWPAAPAAAPAK